MYFNFLHKYQYIVYVHNKTFNKHFNEIRLVKQQLKIENKTEETVV